MNTHNFEIISLSAADLPHAGIAVATLRAGGSALLDLDYCRDEATALGNLRSVAESGANTSALGLRLRPEHVELAARLTAAVPGLIRTWLLAGDVHAVTTAATALLRSEGDVLLIEITDADAVTMLDFPHDGLVLRGHEAGGWVGADTSYILLQKVMAQSPQQPVYVMGGIGIYSAAACRAAGAAGVVLDEQLLLLAESPLAEPLKLELARLNGSETRLFGELFGTPCRIYSRPGNTVLREIEAESRAAESGELDAGSWRKALQARLGWNETSLLPLGQGIGVAARYRDRHRSVGRLIQAIRRASLKQIETAAKLQPLAAGAPLAQSHGTRYPLAQGPMTRVSDNADFAAAVARGGALPFLALALMRGPQVAEMLEQTRAAAGDLPWGVGMLGFVPHALRQEQCEAIWACKPPYALIAGGRPDQAAEFEQHGIATYIHAPAPALLKMYLEQGAKRFVFEGRECGGHIGPLASFPLWEQMIEMLLAEVKPGGEKDIHLLFAGGVHDATSGAMLAALTAPLAARGFKVGALMGTAYLFTQEIVESGAIVAGFQHEALACTRTANLETGPGHATRCADTSFAREFHDARRKLLAEGKSAEELRDALEDLNLGRLRIASKGLDRDDAGKIITVEEAEQHRDGMYMIGQVATLRDGVQSIEALHRDVTENAQALLRERVDQSVEAPQPKPSDIAVIGIGTLLPKADDAGTYWENILDQVNAIQEVPASRWDWQLYFDADRTAKDKIYSRWGGFLDEVPFDPLAYGIPPRVMKQIDPLQLLTLEVVRRGLSDAGWRMNAADGDDDFDRENTSIILGTSGGLGDLGTQYAVRAEIPRFVDNPSAEVWDRLPEWSEESFAGSLLNVATGRVANRMNLGGLNFTVDAACASSLAAISIAVNELESGRSNVAIAGGVDTVQSPFGYLCFSKTQALSPNGKARTFDQGADGIAISEGLAVVVLKRLSDAERDGDRIYAVIKSMAGSSDGRALGMTAPRPEGQMRALERAYARAGFSPATLGMAEAHGTGTAVGDRAEARTITETLKAEGAPPQNTAIGSVKTLLGHTKASAGVAGLIKVALSLYYRTLPAHAGVEKPIEPIAESASPVYLLRQPRPWLAHPDHPRRGGVSAFGFGGTNFHGVLEEYRGGPAASGAQRWPWELLVFRADDESALAAELKRLSAALASAPRLKLGDLAYSLAIQAETHKNAPLRLSIVARDLATLAVDLETAQAHLAGNSRPLPPTLRLGRGNGSDATAIGFLFPGQGAQYVNMGREPALYIEELRQALELADRSLRDEFPQLLSRTILPPSAFDVEHEEAQAQALTDTRVAQPAIGALSLGYLWFARRIGLKAVATAGHSYGEYTALAAAGVLAAEPFLRLSAARGKAMGDAAQSSAPGTMAAVQADRARVTELIEGLEGVRIANHNAPGQAVISGPVEGVAQALSRCGDAGVRATRLPVSGAFHTELVAGAQQALTEAIRNTGFDTPQCAVYSNTRGDAYPNQPEAMRTLLEGHLLNSVEFVSEIEAMYAAGVRSFIELGPKSICSNMARQTLAGRDDAVTVSLDGAGGGLRGLLLGLSELYAEGVAFSPLRLFDGRDLQPLDLANLARHGAAEVLPKHMWMVSGGCARAIDDPVFRTGLKPQLNHAAVQAAAEAARSKPQHPPHQAPAPAIDNTTTPVATAAMAAPPAAMGTDAIAAYQATMRQFLSLQEKVMQQFMGGSPSTIPSTVPGLPTQVAVNATPKPATSISPQQPAVAPPAAVAAAPERIAPEPAAEAVDLQKLLLDIVADRTGYPPEMLALEADLEADLGIDSIKRVEVLGAFQKALPASAGSKIQAAMERFTKARSLSVILIEARACLPNEPASVSLITATTVDAPAITPAPAAAVDYAALLIGIVADRTGYPPEMLDAAADLEADLGIDSIKRVEILGAFQKALPASVASAVQSSMEQFTKARSLNAIIEETQRLAPAAAAVEATNAVVAPEPTPAAAEASFDARAALLEIVADRTGYPQDMLALDADLEADLGIDSIKRVEILGAFQKVIPTAKASALQASMERFTKARSLEAILAEYSALAGAATTPAPRQPSSTSVKKSTEAQSEINVQADAVLPRFLLKSQPMPLSGENLELSGMVLLMGGPQRVVQIVSAELEHRGLTPVLIDAVDADGINEAISVALGTAREHSINVCALLHLHGLEAVSADNAPGDLPAWRALGQRTVLSLFQATQALAANRRGNLEGLRVISTTRLGGTLGRDATGRGATLAGGVCGILNCLHQEYPAAIVRTVDFDGQRDSEIAALLIAELFTEDSQIEAGYIGRQRHGVVTVAQPLQDHAFAPRLQAAADWVVLVTGGARGITAEILEAMVVPGLKLRLLGRTAEPAAEDANTAAFIDAASLKKALIQAALERGEKPMPADIDKAVARCLVDREIRTNLKRLRDRGAAVEYLPCDVRDGAAFGAVIDDTYARHDRIDLVIHAAGVIEDKLLTDKTAASFERVFGTKTDPAFVLMRHLKPDNLKAIAFFTSVAGRYGNRGQTDYAAGNEALNRIAWGLSREWPSTRVLSINWGPWDAGMASEAVRRAFRERGVEPIPVAAGCRYFTEELALGSRQDVEIVAGDGPWKTLGPTQSTAQPTATVPVTETYPLIRDALRMGPGGNMTLDHVFTLDADPYLRDHCIDGKAVLPAAGALEWMAQFVGAAWPGWHVVELRDMRQLNGVVLKTDRQAAVQFRARASSHSDSSGQTVTVEMVDPVRKISFYRATAVLLQTVPAAPAASTVEKLDASESLDIDVVYKEVLFHGDRFQLIRSVEALAAGGVDASLGASSPVNFLGAGADGDAWLFDPGLIDVPPQLAFVWGRLRRDMGALPARFGAVLRYGEGPIRGPIRLSLRLKPPSHDNAIVYDAQFIDADDRVRLSIIDGESTMSAALNRLSPNHSQHIAGLQA